MPKADTYRDRARRLRVMAHDTAPQIHRELLDISEQYERLADQAEMMARPLWTTRPADEAPRATADGDMAAADDREPRINRGS